MEALKFKSALLPTLNKGNNNSKAIKVKASRVAVMTNEDEVKVVSVTTAPNKANRLAYTKVFDGLALEKVELMHRDETDVPAKDRQTSVLLMHYVLLAKVR